jgi:valyl-tRNA synthetase
MNECKRVDGFDPAQVTEKINRWIVTGVTRLGGEVASAIADYSFHQAASLLYGFVWNSFCDWYLEFAKPIFQGTDETAKAETRATAAWVLEQILHYLHPFMPFITEELWVQLWTRQTMLAMCAWPQPGFSDDVAAAEMEWLVRLISAVRAVRGEMNVPPSAKIPMIARGGSAETHRRLEAHREIILALARVTTIELGGEVSAKGALQVVVDDLTVLLPVADVIDFVQEKARLSREVAKLDGEIAKIAGKLSNEAFIARAKPEVIEEQRERLEDFSQAKARLCEALNRLDQL